MARSKASFEYGERDRFEDQGGREPTERDVARLLGKLVGGSDVERARLEAEAQTRAAAEIENRDTTVYRLFDESGDLLYVGITNRGHHRLHQHAKDKPWWSEVATATFEHLDTRSSALSAEAKAIRTEHPRYNIVVPNRVRGAQVFTPRGIPRPSEGHRRVRGTHPDHKALIGSGQAWETLTLLARRHFKATATDVVRMFEAGDLDNDSRLPLVISMLSLVELPIEEFGE